MLELGGFGGNEGQFSDPQGLFVDSEGNVFVADTKNNRIQKFDSKGNYVHQFGEQGDGPGNLECPKCICYSNGLVFDS